MHCDSPVIATGFDELASVQASDRTSHLQGEKMAGCTGLEPATSGLTGQRSNQN